MGSWAGVGQSWRGRWPEEHSPGPRAGEREGRGGGRKHKAWGRVWVFYTYGGATSSSGTSRAARTCFTLRGRDKRLRSEK